MLETCRQKNKKITPKFIRRKFFASEVSYAILQTWLRYYKIAVPSSHTTVPLVDSRSYEQVPSISDRTISIETFCHNPEGMGKHVCRLLMIVRVVHPIRYQYRG